MYVLYLALTFIIAILFGKAMKKIKMPAILGWLIAGMALGPFGFKLLSVGLMDQGWYQILIEVFESFVGVMIGSELIIKQLKKSGKQIITIALYESLATFVFVTIAFLVLFYFVHVPLYLAFIFGAIALATAPAPSLSIVNEYKTKGPVTNTLIPIVALDDVIGISVFVVVIAVIMNLFSTESLPIYMIFVLILAPLVIGGVMGFVSSTLMKSQSKLNLVYFVSLLLVASALGYVLNHYVFHRSIINFMLVGMSYAGVVVNRIHEKDSHQLMEEFKPFLFVGIVLVIVNLGAPLDFRLIAGAGLFTVFYIISRAIGKIGGSYFGSKVTKAPETVRKYLGLTLLPHSGVSLVFTGMAATMLIGFDTNSAVVLQSTIAAAAVINEFIAVILAKRAFQWAGEIEKESTTS